MANLEDIYNELVKNTATIAGGDISFSQSGGYYNGSTLASFSSGASMPLQMNQNGYQIVVPRAKYNSTAPTYNNGDPTPLQSDANGNLLDSMATKLAGEDLTNDKLVVEQRNSYALATLASITIIKSGAGFIHCFSSFKESNPSFSIYDALTPTNAIFESGPNFKGYILLDESFATGLTIQTAGVGQAPSINFSYR